MKHHLNLAAWRAARRLTDTPERFGCSVQRVACGATVVDCGVERAGGFAAGLHMARVCLADLAEVSLAPGDANWGGPRVAVAVGDPLWACLGSQYAGWKISAGDFFAMGSGPMRLLRGREPMLDALELKQSGSVAVGVLECSAPPDNSVCEFIAEACGVPAKGLTLLAARTKSLAGGVQIAARSVETALHKLHELSFDVASVRSGWGAAPAPPPAADDMRAIGRTNDAILYGADVWLTVDADDDALREVGPQTPSSASRDYGRPFADIFREYEYDFYRVDPMLFSPARVTLTSIRSGVSHVFGDIAPQLLQQSFFG